MEEPKNYHSIAYLELNYLRDLADFVIPNGDTYKLYFYINKEGEWVNFHQSPFSPSLFLKIDNIKLTELVDNPGIKSLKSSYEITSSSQFYVLFTKERGNYYIYLKQDVRYYYEMVDPYFDPYSVKFPPKAFLKIKIDSYNYDILDINSYPKRINFDLGDVDLYDGKTIKISNSPSLFVNKKFFKIVKNIFRIERIEEEEIQLYHNENSVLFIPNFSLSSDSGYTNVEKIIVMTPIIK